MIPLTPEDRAYYRENWGFDPVDDRIILRKGRYRYECWFSLSDDPYPPIRDIQMGARVDWGDAGISHNQIIFKSGKREAGIYCTHTVVNTNLSDKNSNHIFNNLYEGEIDARELMAFNPAGRKIDLPPWEHFAALKSFVAGLTEIGLANLLSGDFSKNDADRFILPFGVNSAFQQQLFQALLKIDPKSTRALIREYLFNLIETTPVEWLRKQQSLLGSLFQENDIFIDLHLYAPHEWLEGNQDKLLALGDTTLEIYQKFKVIFNHFAISEFILGILSLCFFGIVGSIWSIMSLFPLGLGISLFLLIRKRFNWLLLSPWNEDQLELSSWAAGSAWIFCFVIVMIAPSEFTSIQLLLFQGFNGLFSTFFLIAALYVHKIRQIYYIIHHSKKGRNPSLNERLRDLRRELRSAKKI